MQMTITQQVVGAAKIALVIAMCCAVAVAASLLGRSYGADDTTGEEVQVGTVM